ncbi:Transmembrane protein 126A [Camponotus japonicus]
MERAQQHIRHDIPKDAVLLSKYEALNHQTKFYRNWKPQSDVWPLLYGRPILATAAACTGFYINLRFRKKLRLRDYGWLPTIVSLTAVPTAMTGLFYSEFVLNKLLLLEVRCPLCLEIRSVLSQIFTGVFCPLMLVPIANFSMAHTSGTFNVPLITDVKKTLKIVSSVYQPMLPTLATIFTLHVLLAGFITHSQIKSLLHILDVQYYIEEEQKNEKHAPNNL